MAVKAGIYRGVSAEDRALRRRARLLEATLAVWGAEAGPPVTMTRVCAEAGLTERYFYQEFDSLDGALTALLQQLGDLIATAVTAAITGTSGGPTDRVRAAVAAVVDLLVGDPSIGRVLLVQGPSRPELRGLRARLRGDLARLVARDARELYADRAWAEREGELAALVFLGGVETLLAAWTDGSLVATPDELVEAAVRAFTATAHR